MDERNLGSTKGAITSIKYNITSTLYLSNNIRFNQFPVIMFLLITIIKKSVILSSSLGLATTYSGKKETEQGNDDYFSLVWECRTR